MWLLLLLLLQLLLLMRINKSTTTIPNSMLDTDPIVHPSLVHLIEPTEPFIKGRIVAMDLLILLILLLLLHHLHLMQILCICIWICIHHRMPMSIGER